MNSDRGPRWGELFDSKQKEIQQECRIDFQASDVPQFQRFLHDLTVKYSQKRFSRCLTRLSGSLEHVKSFTQAIMSFAQASDLGSLIWGSLQVVIECVCRFSNAIESILDFIANMNNALPMYTRNLALYPNALSLQWRLYDIFSQYMNGCLVILKHLNRHPTRNFVSFLFSSSFKSKLEKTTKSISNTKEFYIQELQQNDREVVAAQALEHTRNLGVATAPSADPFRSSSTQLKPELKFPVTTITTIRNPSFVGRDDELAQIHGYINPSSRTDFLSPLCCVLYGLGGQGKSQVALEYYFRHRGSYHGAFWLKSETAQELERSYADIGKRLRRAEGLDQTSRPPSPENELSWEIEYAREWLEGTNKNWLLIFDNLEDAKLVETYLPVNLSGSGSIIITTQKAHMSPLTNEFYKISLQPLLTSVGSTLLFKTIERGATDEQEEGTAHEISRWVGGLPLAIVTIGAYIKCSLSTPGEILASLQRSSQVWASSGEGSVRNYEKTLATVFDLALSELSDDSKHLIHLMAFLNPDNIPEDMLTQDHTLPSLGFLNNQDGFLSMRRDLGLRQLIQRIDSPAGPSLSIHRSLQMNVLHGLKKDPDSSRRQKVFEEVYTMINNVLPPASRLQQNEKAAWPLYYKYVPQILNLRRNSQWPDPPLTLNFQFAKMLSNIGTFLWHTGQFRECEMAMKTAEQIILSQDDDFQKTAECEEILSDIYLVTGILADCIGVSRRDESLKQRLILLELREKELKSIPNDQVTVEDEIRWGNAKGDLACAYLQRYQYQKAKDITEELLGYYKKWGSEDEYPYEYGKYYHHSAFILMAEGDPEKAIQYARKGVEFDLMHGGEVDETVLTSQYDLASLLFNAGKLDESLKLHEDVLKSRIQKCGKGSQVTLESYEAAATILHLTGENVKAREYFAKCLTSRYRANWTTEGIARVQYWHSQVLKALGDKKAAEREAKSAQAVKDQFLKNYPEFLQEDPENEVAVFDQMLPIWIMQSTGRLQKGGRNQTHEMLNNG